MIYVIIGPPRSGTSLLAGILHTNNIWMGEGFPPSDHNNKRGYWEDGNLRALSGRILGNAGGTFSRPPDAMKIAAQYPSFISETTQWLNEKAAKADWRDWGWKDPRLTLSWPIFKTYLEEHDARIFITDRDINSCVSSMVKVFGLARPMAIKTYKRYQASLDAIRDTTPLQWLDVPFEDWWRDFDAQRARVDAFVGRELEYKHFDEGLSKVDR